MKRNFLKSIAKLSLYEGYQAFKSYRLQRHSKDLINNYFKNSNISKLHIGAGGTMLETWLNVDIEPLSKNIAYMDASKTFPFIDNSFDYIYSEHLFEHLTLQQQQFMLSECIRVLKNTGKLRIATPNFDFIVSQRKGLNKLMDEYIDWYVGAFYPDEMSSIGSEVKNEVFFLNNYFHNWGHQFIHNYSTINLLLGKAGFKNIKNVKIYESESEDFKNLERHGMVIPKIFNDMETMVVEATKR